MDTNVKMKVKRLGGLNTLNLLAGYSAIGIIFITNITFVYEFTGKFSRPDSCKWKFFAGMGDLVGFRGNT